MPDPAPDHQATGHYLVRADGQRIAFGREQLVGAGSIPIATGTGTSVYGGLACVLTRPIGAEETELAAELGIGATFLALVCEPQDGAPPQIVVGEHAVADAFARRLALSVDGVGSAALSTATMTRPGKVLSDLADETDTTGSGTVMVCVRTAPVTATGTVALRAGQDDVVLFTQFKVKAAT